METIRKPLKSSILKGIGLFVITLCVFLVGVQYFFLRSTLYTQYQNRIASILNVARHMITDVDDLEECIRTGKKSGQYHELQAKLDNLKESSGIHYVYVIVPLNMEENDNIRNVIAGTTQEEYEEDPNPVELNSPDTYPKDVARKYMDAYNSDGTTYFENMTAHGYDYTGTIVLRNSSGERVAMLCVDCEASEIHMQIRESLLDLLIVVVILGLLFATVFMIWADRHIVQPIRTVEEDVVRLARKSHTSRNPDAMVYSAEEIKTGNEVESLAHAVENMSHDMRDYVKNLVDQEKELVRLSSIANRDPLTHVGNRNAYKQYVDGLQLKMTEGHIEFGILLMNSKGLGRVNEEYGNDKGDLYLQKACRVICEVFHHSPVFRMDGDEFAVMLLGEDYFNRQSLIEEAERIYFTTASDEKTPPWEQVSVTFGLAEYVEAQDRTVGEVYDRAKQMIQGKKDWLQREPEQPEAKA